MAVTHDGSYPAPDGRLTTTFRIPAGINLLKNSRFHLPSAVVRVIAGKIVAEFMGNGTERPGIGGQIIEKEVDVGKAITIIGANGI